MIKNSWALALRLVLMLFILYTAFVSKTAAQATAVESGRKPVVVELFTSEGCSTCPPADALLQKLEEQQPVAGAEIVALEEHVDYWDHDGWSDPYDSPAWTQRQMVYKELFRTNEVYTPQMVVDGQTQFVGSDERKALLAIDQAARRAQPGVTLTPGEMDAKGSQRFSVSVEKLVGNTPGDVVLVWLAVTESGLQSSVNSGENAGRVLHHSATVRSLHKIGVASTGAGPVSFTGTPDVKIESRWNREKLRAIVFIQEKKSGKILGGASAKIP